MLLLHYGLQTSLVEALLQKRIFKNGQVRWVQIFLSHGAAYCTGRGENLRLDHTRSADPLSLLEKIKESGISQDVCINDLESPAFVFLPSLKS